VIDINNPKTDIKKLFKEFVNCDYNKNTWGINNQGLFYFDNFSIITWLVNRRNDDDKLIASRFNSDDERDAEILISAWVQCGIINSTRWDDTYTIYDPVDQEYVEEILINGKNLFSKAMLEEKKLLNRKKK